MKLDECTCLDALDLYGNAGHEPILVSTLKISPLVVVTLEAPLRHGVDRDELEFSP